MIKTIILDLGNVVIPFDHSRIAEKLRRVIARSHNKAIARANFSDLAGSYNRGRVTTSEFLDAFNSSFDSEISIEYFSDAWNSTFGLEPILPDALVRRLSENYQLMALSDTNELHFKFLTKNFPILDHFDDFILSFEVGVTKPAKEIFDFAKQRANCSFDECIFIDDLEINVEGARSLGMPAIRFLTSKRLEKDLKARNLI